MALSPMMQQYMQIKDVYKDTLVFYRLGDFYEMFFDDAIVASRELELTLTGRDCGLEERAPMCGVPYHAVESYVAKLLEKGYKVAICEQTTKPGEQKGIDFLVVRELIGGVYFGEHKTVERNGEKVAIDTMPYAEHEIERIGRIGFETAMKRRKKLTCVDKANVLDTSRLWRAVMHRLQAEYPEVEYSEMFVDNCAMQICKNPAQFDVIVTENMFGDILSDEASEITGSIGMVPSSSLGEGTCGLYEPIHGSAPDIAGQDVVNPIACILSAAMMLRYSFDMPGEADEIEAAVNAVLDAGYRTADMMADGCTKVGCTEMGNKILEHI